MSIVATFIAAVFTGWISAVWDARTIRVQKSLNHYVHAGARLGLYLVLSLLMVNMPWLIVGGWFIVTIAHRLLLNGFMGWDMFYIGKTSWYDRMLNWIADRLDIDEIGQFIVSFEAMCFVVCLIAAFS